MGDIKLLGAFCTQIRRDILRMVHGVQSGHPGGSLGCTEFLSVLFQKFLKHDPSHFSMNAEGEDVFILSNGHISPLYYSVLARTGYFPISELATFRKINSRLQGHPATEEGLPGIRVATGSLGQGLSVAIGMALSKKMKGSDKLVYTLQGDGEMQEGQIWEAVMFAGAKGVDNLIATIDVNRQQIDGSTDDVLPLGSLRDKMEAFGWATVEVPQGNRLASVIEGLEQAVSKVHRGKPICILLHTEMGHGVDFMTGTHKWHGAAPNDEQLKNALLQNEQTLGDY